MLFYPIGCTPACSFAGTRLSAFGIPITDHPCPEVTHLLLDVPSFSEPGKLRCGLDIGDILSMLPGEITVIGGNLNDSTLSNYKKLDLLSDEIYLAKNADITARCAAAIAASHLNTILPETKTLILGWGRIGKMLANLLKGMDCTPTVFARKEKDRAILSALGFPTLRFSELAAHLSEFQLIFNTVPEMLLTDPLVSHCSDCLKIELASKPGIAGTDVLSCRGLPGKCAPESSGNLIAQTILRLLEDEK